MFVTTLRKCGATILALGSGRTPVIALFLRDGVFWFLALVCTLFVNLQPTRAHGQISKWCLLLRSSFGTERVRPWLKSPSCAFIFIDFQKPSLSLPIKSLDIVGTSLMACSLRLKKLQISRRDWRSDRFEPQIYGLKRGYCCSHCGGD